MAIILTVIPGIIELNNEKGGCFQKKRNSHFFIERNGEVVQKNFTLLIVGVIACFFAFELWGGSIGDNIVQTVSNIKTRNLETRTKLQEIESAISDNQQKLKAREERNIGTERAVSKCYTIINNGEWSIRRAKQIFAEIDKANQRRTQKAKN